jgi:hypothetical protein
VLRWTRVFAPVAAVCLFACGSVQSLSNGPPTTAAQVDSPEAAAACDPRSSGTLLAAFVSTAGVVAEWQDNTISHAMAGYTASSTRIANSPWHQLPADATVYVCYWEGTFGGDGPPGVCVRPATRLIGVVAPPSGQVVTWTYGSDQQLPIQRPSATGVEFDYGGPPPAHPISPPPSC